MLLLVALLLAGVGISVFRRHSAGTASAARSSSAVPSRSPADPSSPSVSFSPLSSSATGGAAVNPTGVTVVDTGRPLLGITAGWELFARGPAGLARIQPALGRITTTPLPALGSDGLVSFIVGTDRALIRPQDNVAAYQVRDGQPAAALDGSFGRGGVVLPGPDPQHVWIEVDGSAANPSITMQLATLDGTLTGTSISVPADGGIPQSDGAGYTFFYGIGGIYDDRPSGISRITTGDLLALGATRYLVNECDDQHRCASTVIDRATGQRRALARAVGGNVQAGAISPDGTTAALLVSDSSDSGIVHLIDLGTGADRTTSVALYANQGGGDHTFAWSPDGRWVFVAAKGILTAIDRSSGQATPLTVPVPNIAQVAIRGG